MRILRSQSNFEVSYKGFALFVVGLIFATFMGGAVRTILSSDRVQSRIINELKNRFPRNDLVVGHTQILLARGLWPGLALELHDVVFKQDVCGKLSFELNSPRTVLPVSLWRLLLGQVRLGMVEIDKGSLRLDYHDCRPKPVADIEASSDNSRADVIPKQIKPLRLEWSRISAAIEGLSLRDFAVTYERNLTWKLLLKKADIFVSDDMRLYAAVDVHKSLPFATLTHPITFEARGTKKDISWKIQSEFNEGQLRWQGAWDQVANTAESDLILKQIPVKDVTSEMFQIGLLDREVNLKTAWLTCSASWQGNLESWQDSPLQVRSCKLEGAYGRADLDRADVFIGTEPPLKEPAQVRVQKLQLQPLVESLGRKVLPAVISKLGVWTGAVSYTGRGVWQLDGILENAEVVFSNQSVRGKQVLKSMRTEAQRSGGQMEARVNNIILQDGESKGQVEFRLSEDWRSGDFDANFERVSVSPSIQNLFLGGVLSPVDFTGHGVLEDGDLSDWDGHFHAVDAHGEGWRVEDVSVNSHFKAGVMHIQAQAARAVVESRWTFFNQFEHLKMSPVDALAWKEISAHLSIHRGGGTLASLSGSRIHPVQSWRASGVWVREGEFKGKLLLEESGAGQIFHFKGSRGRMHLFHDEADSGQTQSQ